MSKLTSKLLVATKIGGYGQHVDVVGESPSVLRNFLILVYCLQILYPITIAIIKWSVLAFYRRVFAVETTRLPLYIIGAVTAVWAVAVVNIKNKDTKLNLAHGSRQVVVASVACIPVQGFWDKSINARCINTAMYYFAQAIPNVLTDLALLIFPIPLIWNSRLQRSHKISLVSQNPHKPEFAVSLPPETISNTNFYIRHACLPSAPCESVESKQESFAELFIPKYNDPYMFTNCCRHSNPGQSRCYL